MGIAIVDSTYISSDTHCDIHCTPTSRTNVTSVQDLGQILKIRDCPGDSGTVGAYAKEFEYRASNHTEILRMRRSPDL